MNSSDTSINNVCSEIPEYIRSIECIKDDKADRANDQTEYTEQLQPHKHANQCGERVQADTAGKNFGFNDLAGNQYNEIYNADAYP
jgi:hypothetical protein